MAVRAVEHGGVELPAAHELLVARAPLAHLVLAGTAHRARVRVVRRRAEVHRVVLACVRRGERVGAPWGDEACLVGRGDAQPTLQAGEALAEGVAWQRTAAVRVGNLVARL